MTRLTAVIASMIFLLAIACGGGSSDEATPVASENATAVSSAADAPVILENQLVRLVDPLDDPEHYCIDVRGWGVNVRVEDSLQAHTCKPTDNVDEQFSFDSTTGKLFSEIYKRCLEPEQPAEGSNIFLRECSDDPLQQFEYRDDRTLRLVNGEPGPLCVAVAGGDGIVINAIHKRRELTFEACESTESSLMTWEFFAGAASTE